MYGYQFHLLSGPFLRVEMGWVPRGICLPLVLHQLDGEGDCKPGYQWLNGLTPSPQGPPLWMCQDRTLQVAPGSWGVVGRTPEPCAWVAFCSSLRSVVKRSNSGSLLSKQGAGAPTRVFSGDLWLSLLHLLCLFSFLHLLWCPWLKEDWLSRQVGYRLGRSH